MDLDLFLDKLNEMSREDVIGMCRSRGIKGVRFSSQSCILANLIKDETGRTVYVEGRLVRAKDNRRECYDIADTLTHVAARFDLNDYPDLVV